MKRALLRITIIATALLVFFSAHSDYVSRQNKKTSFVRALSFCQNAYAAVPSKCKLFGKIEVVDAFADVKIEKVDAFADIKVEWVDAFADEPGEWEKVDAFGDFKVEFVDAFGDYKVEFVTAFPGCD